MASALLTAVTTGVAVAEVVGLDDDGVGVVAELGEVGQVARGGEGDRVDVGEPVERIGVVGDGQQLLAVVGAVDPVTYQRPATASYST